MNSLSKILKVSFVIPILLQSTIITSQKTGFAIYNTKDRGKWGYHNGSWSGYKQWHYISLTAMNIY